MSKKYYFNMLFNKIDRNSIEKVTGLHYKSLSKPEKLKNFISRNIRKDGEMGIAKYINKKITESKK